MVLEVSKNRETNEAASRVRALSNVGMLREFSFRRLSRQGDSSAVRVLLSCKRLRLSLAIAHELEYSRPFRRSFVAWIRTQIWQEDELENINDVSIKTEQVLQARKCKKWKLRLCCPLYHGQESELTHAEMEWSRRLLLLTMTKTRLESVFAWLSTLGGAYSALGEIQLNHVSFLGID